MIGNQHFLLPRQPATDDRPRNGFGYLLGFGQAYAAYYADLDKQLAAKQAEQRDKMTPVIYRVDASGEVFALFPTIPADVRGLYVRSYQHVGQHGAADYWHCVRTSRPAKPQEYADLAAELSTIGYTDLVAMRRRTKAHEQALRENLAQQEPTRPAAG